MIEPQPDAGAVSRLWAQGDPDIAAIVGLQVSFKIPTADKWAVPLWLRFQVIDGGKERGEVPRFRYVIQWDAYDRDGDLTRASNLIHVVAAKAERVVTNHVSIPSAKAYLQGNDPILGPRPEIDDPGGWARYRMDSELVFLWTD